MHPRSTSELPSGCASSTAFVHHKFVLSRFHTAQLFPPLAHPGTALHVRTACELCAKFPLASI